jgi:hypothetical protein
VLGVEVLSCEFVVAQGQFILAEVLPRLASFVVDHAILRMVPKESIKFVLPFAAIEN